MAVGETSLEKMLRVLDEIEDGDGTLTSEDLLTRLHFTRSTLYRYLKVLSAFGLVSSFPGRGYTFGPCIAEMNYKMRLRDLLILASRPVMAELVRETPGIALLCRRYRDKVLCVHQERGATQFASVYERGRARPLTQGAASRIILANMPWRQVAHLFAHDSKAFRDGRLGETATAVRSALKEIRQRGWDVTAGHVMRGVTGIAAPILDHRGAVLGSLGLTVGGVHLLPSEVDALAERVTFCARIVSKAVHGDEPYKNPK